MLQRTQQRRLGLHEAKACICRSTESAFVRLQCTHDITCKSARARSSLGSKRVAMSSFMATARSPNVAKNQKKDQQSPGQNTSTQNPSDESRFRNHGLTTRLLQALDSVQIITLGHVPRYTFPAPPAAMRGPISNCWNGMKKAPFMGSSRTFLAHVKTGDSTLRCVIEGVYEPRVPILSLVQPPTLTHPPTR